MNQDSMPWRNPSRLTAADKARLTNINDTEAEALDVTSDEHEYVWEFRQNRPDEEHRERLGEILHARIQWHHDLAGWGHTMSWQLQDFGAECSPEWQGACTDCGANMSAGYSGSSMWRGGKDAREVICSGPGTAWQDEMVRDRQYQLINGAVAEFGQVVKNVADREWLRDQGIEPEAG